MQLQALYLSFLLILPVYGVIHQGMPPRGWNSYDGYTCTVSEDEVKANADYMQQHLSVYGYEYVVIDYEWFRPGKGQFSCCDHQSWQDLVIDEYGRLQPCPLRYPSSKGGKGLKPLADYVHNLDLKFGIHIMRGIPRVAVEKNLPIYGSKYTAKDAADETKGCSWCDDMWGIKNNAAGQAYYNSIIELYSVWGVDYIKMDCAYSDIYLSEIDQINEAIKNNTRDFVLSMSPTNRDPKLGDQVKTNVTMYRINGDVWDNWNGVMSAFSTAPLFVDLIGSPSYPDLDMLPLGHLSVRQGHGPSRQSQLTKDEQFTLMTLWAMFRNPLIIGGALSDLKNDSFTTSLLTNKGVLEINSYSKYNHPVNTSLFLGNEPSSGLTLNVEKCSGWQTVEQRWSIENNGTIMPDYNRYCLTVHNCDGKTLRAQMCNEPNTCSNGINQLWTASDLHLTTIKSQMDGSCLTIVDDPMTKSGLSVTMAPCKGGNNQQWTYNWGGSSIQTEVRGMNVCLAITHPGKAWTAKGKNGEVFLALFNTEDVPANISIALNDMYSGEKYSSCMARDVWFGGAEREVKDNVFARLPSHGTALYNLTQCH